MFSSTPSSASAETKPHAVVYLSSASPGPQEKDFARRFCNTLQGFTETKEQCIFCKVNKPLKYGENLEHEAPAHTIYQLKNDNLPQEFADVDVYFFDCKAAMKGALGCMSSSLFDLVILALCSLVGILLSLFYVIPRIMYEKILCGNVFLKISTACMGLSFSFLTFTAALLYLFISAAPFFLGVIELVRENPNLCSGENKVQGVNTWCDNQTFSRCLSLGAILCTVILFLKNACNWGEHERKVQGMAQLINGLSIYATSRKSSCLDGYNRAIYGRLKRFLEQIKDKDKRDYGCVSFVSYSMGTILSIDAIFPFEDQVEWFLSNHEPNPNPFLSVKNLVTIGCPFDIMRAYVSYYPGREVAQSLKLHWTNMYIKGDPFGSPDICVGTQTPANQGQGDPQTSSFNCGRPQSNIDLKVNRGGIICGGLVLHSRYFDKNTDATFCAIAKALGPKLPLPLIQKGLSKVANAQGQGSEVVSEESSLLPSQGV